MMRLHESPAAGRPSPLKPRPARRHGPHMPATALPYKLISLLLQYPDERVRAARDEIGAAVGGLLDAETRRALERFLAYWDSAGPVMLEQNYMATFDCTPRVSLFLTHALHGDRRQRGMALVRLKQRYEAAGLRLLHGELPDYLPVLLEFAAFAPVEAGRALLADYRSPIELVRLGLHDMGSPYAHLLDALCLSLPPPTA